MALIRSGRLAPAFAASILVVLLGASSALFGVCGPFTDVAADAFCPFVLEIFYLGITTGTTPTTYDPSASVSRLQMAAFLSRSVDGVLRRGSLRGPMKHFWTGQGLGDLGLTTVGVSPVAVAFDGQDLWVANRNGGGTLSRVRASDGKFLETWTGATNANSVLVAGGRVFSTDLFGTNLYRVDPSQPAGVVTTVATNLGLAGVDLTFDGIRIWTANFGAVTGSVSLVTPAATIPWTVTTVTAGFTRPNGILYDGSNVWVADFAAGTLLKLNASAGVLQTVTVGSTPLTPVFDGTNIWVPNNSPNTVTVVRASNGVVLATLTGNGLSNPSGSAFDGQRVLITSFADSVSIWKAADLTALGTFSTGAGTAPGGAASDGVHFWVTLFSANKLARY